MISTVSFSLDTTIKRKKYLNETYIKNKEKKKETEEITHK